jgi:hypothetical protein
MFLNRPKRRGVLYLPYIFNNNTQVLGHYRCSTGSQTTSGAVGANGIIFGAVYGGPNIAVLLRLSLAVKVGTAGTVAQAIDFNLFSFTGAGGKYTGSSATHITGLGNAQMRPNMQSSQWFSGSNGDICSLGGSLTTLVAASGRTNSTNPIGSAAFGSLYNSSATGTATLITPGAALSPQNADLYTLQPGISHPLCLGINSGVEIQQIAASANSLILAYIVTMEWAEVANL